MNTGTMQVFSGSAITPEELLVLAEFAAPSHFISDDQLRDAADNLAEWTDHRSSTIVAALHLAFDGGEPPRRPPPMSSDRAQCPSHSTSTESPSASR